MIEAPLTQFTTIGIGGSAKKLMVARSENEIITAVDEADKADENVVVLGSGSNVLFPDADPETGVGFDGTVILVASEGIKENPPDPSGRIFLEVQAGHGWDRLVEYSSLRGFSGLEALSGIPGTVGAAPVQNIGAYGVEVRNSLSAVRAWDRQQRRVVALGPDELGFSYRSSALKKALHRRKNYSLRYVVLAVQFQLLADKLGLPVRYSELADRLGIALGEKMPVSEVRRAVLELRQAKGMVIDRSDRDTYSTGSFFTNPVIGAAKASEFSPDTPQYPQSFKRAEDGVLVPETVKLSAAWLIGKAGFEKGYGLEGTAGYRLTAGRASLSTKHTLAFTNRGLPGAGATQKDVLSLKETISAGVYSAFGVKLEPETIIVTN